MRNHFFIDSINEILPGHNFQLQIEEKQYETELVEKGIKQIKKLAIAFSGKEVCVKESLNSGII